jgi:hypothetical protein
MEWEFRVFVHGALMFRATVLLEDLQQTTFDHATLQAAFEFRKSYPHIDMNDPDVVAHWSDPLEPPPRCSVN